MRVISSSVLHDMVPIYRDEATEAESFKSPVNSKIKKYVRRNLGGFRYFLILNEIHFVVNSTTFTETYM